MSPSLYNNTSCTHARYNASATCEMHQTTCEMGQWQPYNDLVYYIIARKSVLQKRRMSTQNSWPIIFRHDADHVQVSQGQPNNQLFTEVNSLLISGKSHSHMQVHITPCHMHAGNAAVHPNLLAMTCLVVQKMYNDSRGLTILVVISSTDAMQQFAVMLQKGSNPQNAEVHTNSGCPSQSVLSATHNMVSQTTLACC